MIHELIHLEKNYKIKGKATLEAFISDNVDSGLFAKPALIIVPGGGYGFISRREADPIAFKFSLLKSFLETAFKLLKQIVLFIDCSIFELSSSPFGP